MKFYKIEKNKEIVGYSKTNVAAVEDGYVEIAEDEYNSALTEIRVQAEAQSKAAEQSKDDRIAELEKENAALLFQVLTGEEYADV